MIGSSGSQPGRARLVAAGAVELRLVVRSVFWRLRLVFVLEQAENDEEAPLEWFRLNPDDGEDSTEVSDSSGEEEGEEEEGDEEEALEVGADGQPQLDRASSNEPRPTEPATARGDQAETNQPDAPGTGTADPSGPPNPSVVS